MAPKLNKTKVRELADDESFRRGEEYLRRGAVSDLVLRGEQLLAQVEGSQYTPYRVSIIMGDGGVHDFECNCPYDWGGACKHVIATLLAYIADPKQVKERQPLESILAEATAEELRAVLIQLAQGQPGLIDLIEAQVQTLRSLKSAPAANRQAETSKRHAQIEPAPYRRQVTALLHSLDRMSGSQAYYAVGGVVAGVRQVAEQARPFMEAGDARSALLILEAVTDEYVQEWEILDDSDGEASALFDDLGDYWAEALLSGELSAEERKGWAKKLKKWQRSVDDYGVEAFDNAIDAAKEGWDDPGLQAVLRG